TMGGNIVTASPIGDSAPILLALEAKVVLVSLEPASSPRPSPPTEEREKDGTSFEESISGPALSSTGVAGEASVKNTSASGRGEQAYLQENGNPHQVSERTLPIS